MCECECVSVCVRAHGFMYVSVMCLAGCADIQWIWRVKEKTGSVEGQLTVYVYVCMCVSMSNMATTVFPVHVSSSSKMSFFPSQWQTPSTECEETLSVYFNKQMVTKHSFFS